MLVENGDTAEAVIQPDANIPVDVVPCDGHHPGELLAELAERPFDLYAGPPLRIHILETGPQHLIALLVLHHIVCDAWSLDVLATDLANACRTELPPLRYTYHDVAEAQLASAARRQTRTIAFWRERLRGAPAALDLTSAQSRPEQQSMRGRVHRLAVPDTLIAAAAETGIKRGMTLASVLLAAWAAVLRRDSGQDDLIIGTAVAGRDSAEAAEVVGPLANLVPLRVTVDPVASPDDLLAAAHQALLGALDHAGLPFARLVEAVQPARRRGVHPVFQTTFDLRHGTLRTLEFWGSRALPVPLDTAPARLDLALSVDRSVEGWTARLVASVDLFTPETADRLLADFIDTIHALVTSPEPVRTGTALPAPDRTVVDLFDRSVRLHPTRVAVEDGHSQLTYQELDRTSRALAARLIRFGVTSDATVGIFLVRGVGLVTALLATLRAGGAYLALDPDHPATRTALLLDDAGASIVLTSLSLQDRISGAGRTTLLLEGEEVTDSSEATVRITDSDQMVVAPQARTLAYVIYTSGSTGRPKGVEVTHGSLAALLEAMGELIDLNPSDALLAITTLTFDIAALELFLPLSRGGRVVVAQSGTAGDPARIRRLCAEHGVTVLQATPVTWRALMPDPVPGLRVALCGGERLSADLARQLVRVAEKAWNVYGPTETTIWSTAQSLDADVCDPVPIGHPLEGTCAYVLGRSLSSVLPGDPGELCLGGAGVARGYRGQPELTAEKFAPDPFRAGERLYRSGDQVRLRSDGRLVFLGRLDHQLKIRGLRVEPGEIESAVRALPGVQDAVVVAPLDSKGEPVLTCYVVTDRWCPPQGIRAALSEVLPAHLVPSTIMPLAALPLTSSGKVDRRALPAPTSGSTTRPDFTGPRDEVERTVAAVWKDVLGRDDLSVHDDFFELGGHSLLATQIIARLSTRFQVDLPFRLLLDRPTIATTARLLDACRSLDLPLAGPLNHHHDVPAPLTPPQQQIWLLSRDPAAEAAYRICAVFPLPEQLRIAETRQIVETLTVRHCVLRTHFPVVDGEPRQVVVADTVDLAEIRLPEENVRTFLTGELRAPFALADAPPVRWRVLRTPERSLLILSTHHITVDGWSIGLLKREFWALSQRTDLPPAPCLAAVARWQRRVLSSAELDRQRGYWRDRLESFRPVPTLPYTRTPPSRPDFAGGLTRSTVSPGIRALARRLDATLFMTLLAAYTVELHRYGGETDLCVGVPMAARRSRELEDAVGMLVNSVVIRCDLTGDPTFAELVYRVRDAVLDAHAHQETPFAEVARYASVQPYAGRNPYYQTMFGVDAAATSDRELRVHGGTAKLDLTVMMTSTIRDGPVELSWEYASQVLDRSTVDQLAARYRRLVEAVCANPHRRLHDLAPALTPPPVPVRRVRPAPRSLTLVEQPIAEVFTELLGISNLGPEDDFFDLGGHSLLAANAVAAIGSRTGTRLPPRALMENPTIAGLARALAHAGERVSLATHDGRIVLVTGGTGLVGAAIVAELHRRGIGVRILARPAALGRARSLADEVAEGDLAEPDSVADAAEGVDAIVHAATTFDCPDVDVAAMDALVGVRSGRPMVFIGSTDVYGTQEGKTLHERHAPASDLTRYAQGKVACERLLRDDKRSGFGLLRPPYVWADHPYCLWQTRQTVGAPLEEAARRGLPVALPPARRGHAWVDSRDLAWLVAECLDRPPDGPVNVVGGHFSWRALAPVLARLRSLRVDFYDGEPSGLYATHRRFSGQRAAIEFGFAPRRRWISTLTAAYAYQEESDGA